MNEDDDDDDRFDTIDNFHDNINNDRHGHVQIVKVLDNDQYNNDLCTTNMNIFLPQNSDHYFLGQDQHNLRPDVLIHLI